MWLNLLAIVLAGSYAAAVAFVPLWLMERGEGCGKASETGSVT